MDESKKWMVTYTKHKTHKRKVYQDGTLELRTSSGKLVLLNDGGELLESRMVKKNEVVESGGTTEFCGYLVDVGELEGSCRPVSDSILKDRSEPVPNKTQKLAVKIEGNETGAKRSGLHKFCPKFKTSSLVASMKVELHNTPMTQSQPNTTDTSRNDCVEWDVLYTTQMTQKAKRYHDGVLKILSCGSMQKQAFLSDEDGRILCSKFLKSVDVIDSGGTLVFDTHIIQIENMRNTSKNSDTINTAEKCKVKTEIVDLGTPKSCMSASQKEKNIPVKLTGEKHSDTTIEWHVLYTAQKVQKAKKYHDGILKITSSGTMRHQATLLDEDGSVLGSKHLMSSENVTFGRAFEMANYLIDIGEPKAFSEEETKVSSAENLARPNSNISDGCNVKAVEYLSSDKSLRDATQILSVLRRPESNDIVDEKKVVALKRPSEQLDDQIPESRSSHSKRSMKMNLKDISFSSPFEQVFSSNITASEVLLNVSESDCRFTRLDSARVSNEESDGKPNEKLSTKITSFSEKNQNVKDYNSSNSRLDEIECTTALLNASDCMDYRPLENIQAKKSLEEFGIIGRQTLMDPQIELQTAAGPNTQEKPNPEEENYELESSKEESLSMDGLPTFDLGF